MDIQGISRGPAAQATQQRVGDAVGIKVLSTAMNIQANSAAKLLSSVPEVKPPSEPHLGNNVNTTA